MVCALWHSSQLHILHREYFFLTGFFFLMFKILVNNCKKMCTYIPHQCIWKSLQMFALVYIIQNSTLVSCPLWWKKNSERTDFDSYKYKFCSQDLHLSICHWKEHVIMLHNSSIWLLSDFIVYFIGLRSKKKYYLIWFSCVILFSTKYLYINMDIKN